MAPPNIKVQGVGSIPPGYILGRIDPGTGDVQLISIAELIKQIRAGVDVDAGLPDTGVTPGTYGDATNVGQFTVDAKGRITFADDVAISGGGGGGGTLELIAEVVTSGSAADVDFTSIATTWRDLEVHVSGRGNAGGVTNVGLQMQFNGDTGGNYDYAFAENNGAGGTAFGGAAAQTSLFVGRLTAATAPANVAAHIQTRIGDYKGTTFEKANLSHSAHKLINSATGTNQLTSGGAWRSTAAINRVRVFPASSTFVDGTVVSLYGRGGSGGGSGSGDWTQLDQITTSGTQSSLTFATLPTSGYTSLKIVWTAVGTDPGQITAINMRFNGDTGNNYSWYSEHRFAATGPATATSMQCAYMPSAGHVNSNFVFPTEVLIPNFLTTNQYKTFRSTQYYRDNTPTSVDVRGGGHWLNTAALTSITIFAGLSAFANGHVFTLYGMK